MDELRKKNIAIRLDIYEKLLDMKHGKDTFSDVIERLLDARKMPKLRK
jgi:predicted CopG family antitoxin